MIHTQIHHNADSIGNNIPIALDERTIEEGGCDFDRTRSSHVFHHNLIDILFRRSCSQRNLTCDGIRLCGCRPRTLDLFDLLLG